MSTKKTTRLQVFYEREKNNNLKFEFETAHYP